jgi:hypothetical protein
VEEYSAIGLDDGKLEAIRQNGIEYRYGMSHEGGAEHVLGIRTCHLFVLSVLQVEELPEDGDVVPGVGRILGSDSLGWGRDRIMLVRKGVPNVGESPLNIRVVSYRLILFEIEEWSNTLLRSPLNPLVAV